MMRDKVTLVKSDGTVAKADMAAAVSPGRIITFEVSIPIEVNDHFLRTLPGGVVEDYIVTDPNFMTGMGPIPNSYQTHVRRSSQPIAPPQVIITNISNSSVGLINTGSTGDITVNMTSGISIPEVQAFVSELAPHLGVFRAEDQEKVKAEIDVINGELTKPTPSPTKVKESVLSIKKIAESTASGLIVKGIIALAAGILGQPGA